MTVSSVHLLASKHKVPVVLNNLKRSWCYFSLSLTLKFFTDSPKTKPQRQQKHFGHFSLEVFKKDSAQLSSTSAAPTTSHCITTLIFTPTPPPKHWWLKKIKYKWNKNKHLTGNMWTSTLKKKERKCLHMPKEEKERTDGFLALSSCCFHTYTTPCFGLMF